MCVASIFRRQWAEHERLVYPMLRPALEMAEGVDGRFLLPPFARSHLFWAGFGIAFGIFAWHMIYFFEPLVPRIPILGSWFSIARGFPYTFHTCDPKGAWERNGVG